MILGKKNLVFMLFPLRVSCHRDTGHWEYLCVWRCHSPPVVSRRVCSACLIVVLRRTIANYIGIGLDCEPE